MSQFAWLIQLVFLALVLVVGISMFRAAFWLLYSSPTARRRPEGFVLGIVGLLMVIVTGGSLVIGYGFGWFIAILFCWLVSPWGWRSLVKIWQT